MADVKFETVRVALNTGTGTQDITISGFGTPVAAMFYFEWATADDTITARTRSSVGYTDGTNQCVTAITSIDNVTTSNTARIQNSTNVIQEITTGSTQGAAKFDSWVTDGVRIDITNAPSGAFFVTVVLIGGADVVSAKAALSATMTSATTVHTVGFEADLIFTNCIGSANNNASSPEGALIFSSAISVNDGSDSNYMVGMHAEDNASTSDTYNYTSTVYCIGQVNNSGGAVWLGGINTYTSTGFTVSATTTPSDKFCYLALEFANNPTITVAMEDSPTVTGTKSFGATSTTPEFGMVISGGNSSLATFQSNTMVGMFVADASNQYGWSFVDEDAKAVTVCKSIIKDGGLVQLITASTKFDSTFTGFTSTGMDLSFTEVNATARKWITLFIGDGAVAGGFETWFAKGSNSIINNVIN